MQQADDVSSYAREECPRILVLRAIRILRVRVGGARKGKGEGKNTYAVSVQVFVR